MSPHQRPAIIAGAAGLGVMLLVWIAAPMLRSPAHTVDNEVGRSAERALRLLEQYNWALEVGKRKTEQAGIEPSLTADKINALAESDSQTAAAALTEQSDKLKEYARSTRTAGQDLEERLKKLDPDVELAAHPNQAFSPGGSGMASDMTKGVAARAKLEQQSNKAMADALAAAKEGLAVTSGSVSGGDSLLGNRVNGVALYQQGLAQHRDAAAARQAATDALHALIATSTPLESLRSESRIAETSNIADEITKQRKAVGEAESKEKEEQAALAELKGRIAKLKAEIEAETAKAEAARAKMEELEARGIRYEQPDAAGQFRNEYLQQATIFRDASSRAQALQFGTLKNAAIDASGDYLTGKFVSASPGGSVEDVPGLDELERQLALRETTAQNAADRTADAQRTLAEVQKMQERFTARATAAQASLQTVTADVQKAYDAYAEKSAAAVAAEDKALSSLKQALAAFKRAKSLADTRASDVPAGLSPAAMELSPYKLMQEDRWLGAELQCQCGDAELWIGTILYDRYSHLKEAATELERIAGRATLSNYDAAAIASAAADAKTQGEEAASGAIDLYENAAGNLKRHWTVAASAAAADYLLALYDHPEMVNIALANYKAVVENRQDDPLVRPFRDRYEQLRTR